MDNILVEVYLPAAGKSYDVYLPLSSKIHEILALLSGALGELSDGHFSAAADTVICDRITGKILDINFRVGEIGLRNGSKLMLI